MNLGERPILHPDFPLICLSFQAKAMLKRKPQRTRTEREACNYCSKPIVAGDAYVHQGKTVFAHENCARYLAAITGDAEL